MNRVAFEWRYTYRSARRDGWSRRVSARKFARELLIGCPRSWIIWNRRGVRRFARPTP